MSDYFYMSPYGDAHLNLAIDEHLLNSAKPGELYLYLYVNSHAVIIGRNQNPWRECDLDAMERDSVQLARRISGGGAVYHDGGNLNFSFISGKGRYDEKAQTGFILSALRSLGIDAEVSGRNDLCVNGRKFSGNAWCGRGENQMRHGTLLIDSDLDKVARYLTPPPAKLSAHGVSSVKSRVCKLSDCAAGLNVDSVAAALRGAFHADRQYTLSADGEAAVAALRQRNASKAWSLGETPRFDYTYEREFDWGTAEICLSVKRGIITGARVYTDAMDLRGPKELEQSLTGLEFSRFQ